MNYLLRAILACFMEVREVREEPPQAFDLPLIIAMLFTLST